MLTRRLSPAAVLVAFAVLFFPLFSTTAHAQVELIKNCVQDLEDWKKRKGFGAFARSSRGGCGFSWDEPSEQSAVRLAMVECRKRGRNCRVIKLSHVRNGKTVISGPVVGVGRRTFKLFGLCKRSYDRWQRRKGSGAFVANKFKRSISCTSSWNSSTISGAVKNAAQLCEEEAQCNVYDIRSNRKEVEKLQEDLETLGYYRSKIDGDWGRGSRSAMSKFLSRADFVDAYAHETIRCLHWAARIVEQLGYSTNEAIDACRKAHARNSISHLKKKPIKVDPIAEPAKPKTGEGSDNSPSEPLRNSPWQFAELQPAARTSDSHERCRLWSDGLEFTYFDGAVSGVIAASPEALRYFRKRGQKSANYKLNWLVDGQRSLVADLRSDPLLGVHVYLPDPIDFLETLSLGKRLSFHVDGQSLANFSLNGAYTPTTRFSRCVRRVGNERRGKLLPDAKKPVEKAAVNPPSKLPGYSGASRDGVPHGFGELLYPNGDRFKGLFFKGVPNGKGIFDYAEGDRFEGGFKNGKPHGAGVLITAEGDRVTGLWILGEHYDDVQ